MKQFLDSHELEHMAVPTVKLGYHQTALRHVLVSRAVNKKDSKPSIPPLQGVLFMKKPAIFAAVGVTTTLSLAVFMLSVVSAPHNVSALQLAENSSRALTHLNPQDADYKKFYPYFVEWMNQAQKAKDLRVLNYEQLAEKYPEVTQNKPAEGEPLRVIDNSQDNQKPNTAKLKYLVFTSVNDANSTIIVGVNNDNIPEAALMHVNKVNNQKSANN